MGARETVDAIAASQLGLNLKEYRELSREDQHRLNVAAGRAFANAAGGPIAGLIKRSPQGYVAGELARRLAAAGSQAASAPTTRESVRAQAKELLAQTRSIGEKANTLSDIAQDTGINRLGAMVWGNRRLINDNETRYQEQRAQRVERGETDVKKKRGFKQWFEEYAWPWLSEGAEK